LSLPDYNFPNQGRSDGGGYIGIYPQNQSTLKNVVVVILL